MAIDKNLGKGAYMVNEFPRKHDSGLTEPKTINPVTVKGPSVLVNCR